MNRAWILAHIPHQGRMCLLDAVSEWDAEHVRCRASSHRDPDNPLRAYGRLGILCGLEYAAQAMAVHGALAAAGRKTTPAAGFLAAGRGITPHVARLDDVEGDLIVTATRAAGDPTSALYDFDISSTGRCLLSGRSTVLLNAGGWPP